MTRAMLSLAVLLSGAPAPAGAVDLTGKWRIGAAFPPAEIVQITQTGSSLSIPWQLPFTGSVGATDANGFTSYQVTWTDGVNQAGFGGRIMPSGNLLDGRAVASFPPNFPEAFGLVATRCNCDDGNSTNGDGCDAACQVEECWTCVGDPSVCTPTLDGGVCDDHSPCTTGETCTAGVCGSSTPVSPCFDMDGPWVRHHFVPGLAIESHTATNVIQRDTDLLIDSYVGAIDPLTGAFNVRSANPNLFCSFNTLLGAVAGDGLTYSASGATQEPDPFAPDHCIQFAAAEAGDHCGDGTVDGLEQCDDGNFLAGDGCSPLCQVEPCFACSGTPSGCTATDGAACDDGDPCTATSFCRVDGSCLGDAPVTCEPCFSCETSVGCVAKPQPVCKVPTAPSRSLVRIKNDANDAKDRFVWRWSKGADVLPSELGNPPGDTDVSLCAYGESTATPSLVFRATIPAGTQWVATARGYRYKESSAAADGMTVGVLKSGSGGTAIAKLKGKGVSLSDRPHGLPTVPLPLPLRIQLQGGNGLCLETRHDASSVARNEQGIFKAKGVP